MKIKVIFSYEEIIENVEKIIPFDKSWNQLEIFTKDGLYSIPNHQVVSIEVVDDAK